MEQEKLYYTIREVSEMFSVPQGTLRFWEKEVRQLEPVTKRGRRYYRPCDLDTIRRIMHLREQNVPVKDWSKRLTVDQKGIDKSQAAIEALKAIREELIYLKNLI